ncbi:MAG: hypothetical protein JNG86_23310 [Verrucomicrobiaceae bacterium]|nr:hypothetical protein [Verrucomicrobiaceae bacterium]
MLEKQQAETEFQRLTSEHRMYEGKFLSLGPNAHSAALVIERQAAAAEQQAAALSVELNGLNGKVVALEAALNKFKPLVETYKAKNSR